MRYSWRILLVMLAIVVGLMGCKGETKVESIKLAHGLAPSHPVHKAMVFFAERVAAKSDSTLLIDIYPSEQLGSERECIELLQIGSLGITKVSTSPLESFEPTFKVFGLPYLFRNDEHRFNVLEGEIGKEFLRKTTDANLRGLCFYDAGSRSFYTVDKPVHEPADLNGLKIRTQESTTAMRMVRALGGSPTPISWGELYSALQQGIVDGAENNPPSFYLSHHYEVCKYYSLDEHTAVPDILLISTVVWNKLTDEQKRIVQEAANESAQHQKKLWAESTKESLEKVKEAGVEIIRPDKEKFRSEVEDLYQTISEERPEMYKMVERIRSVK
ncbi:MAG: TRAP transporter substrate-binding protein [Candidatus Marinimicrobia bacterium]|nr:TRAP transporter substrate-binding protein [Candidatus Neomarinimicrobiota bacterium]MCF7827389.1 TRAP transporter substrate-binding protein [Candidatus Neomarinimicrobiota bacterium]MCF7881378.1 TRAP transporter substrate-binding protein [Candidatus Neomarinimicrobiota bacterium]